MKSGADGSSLSLPTDAATAAGWKTTVMAVDDGVATRAVFTSDMILHYCSAGWVGEAAGVVWDGTLL